VPLLRASARNPAAAAAAVSSTSRYGHRLSLSRSAYRTSGRLAASSASGSALHSERGAHEIPLVIRLNSYVHIPRRATSARISRRAVFARDKHRCQYCGSARHLTVDHVVPRSKGGPDTWDNLVTSCAPCNRKKGDRPLHVAGLQLLRPPRPPGPAAFVLLHVDHVHESWRPYLSYAS
jgi:5-methylcytosine-specific restriction endonuclease McrA